MTLSFSQPVFIPWGGFFCRLQASDLMVLLDDTFLAQGFTWVNRNRIKGRDGTLWTTVPLRRPRGKRQKIRELKIHEKTYWGAKWRETLRHAYARSPFLADFDREMADILADPGGDFLDCVVSILDVLKKTLFVSTPWIRQSEMGVEGRGPDLLRDLAFEAGADTVLLPHPAQRVLDWRSLENAGLAVRFLDFRCPVYPQFWGGFAGNLSAVDLVLCLGAESRRYLDGSYRLRSAE